MVVTTECIRCNALRSLISSQSIAPDWMEGNIKLPEGVSVLGQLTMIAPTHGNVAPVDRRGHRLPETTARYAERSRLICEAAERFFPGASMLEAAIRLHHALDVYACGGWRHERGADACPLHHIGRINGHCWRILHLVDRVPGAEMLRKIIHSQRDAL